MTLCECGCGQETTVYHGVSRRFILGHNRKKPTPESTICECGCGEYATPGKRFIPGHNRRGIKVYSPMKYNIGTEGITRDMVRELFDYRDGEMYWKVNKGPAAQIGDLAGHVNGMGYRCIGINGKRYLAHRLIFLCHHGYLPEFLDHIDGDKLNNDISNLREATITQNGMNSKKQKSMNGKATSSKYKGVTWDKHCKKWRAQIRINGKLKQLGRFTSEIEAARAYDAAANELFGEFAKTNNELVIP